MSLFELTAVQRDLLFIIAECDQPSGQTIKACFEAETDTTVSEGQIYPNLDTLVEMGSVEKGQLDRRANYYMLTERGVRWLRQRQSWEQTQLRSVQVRQ